MKKFRPMIILGLCVILASWSGAAAAWKAIRIDTTRWVVVCDNNVSVVVHGNAGDATRAANLLCNERRAASSNFIEAVPVDRYLRNGQLTAEGRRLVEARQPPR
jgi:hypothetical protein